MKNSDALTGITAIARGARGRAVHVCSFRSARDLPRDGIVIAKVATPDVIFVIERVAGLIFEIGGPASHAAILAREFGVPCVVGVAGATSLIPEGADVVISADGTIRYEAP